MSKRNIYIYFGVDNFDGKHFQTTIKTNSQHTKEKLRMAKKKAKKKSKKKSKKSAISHDTAVPMKTLKEEAAEVKASKPRGQTEEEKVNLEREIRRYVAKHGDYRKGLSQEAKEHCAKLLAQREGPLKNKIAWDRDITISGMDKPSVADIVQKMK